MDANFNSLFGEEPMANYLGSPLNYTGSKFLLLKELHSHFPKSANTFWDLFCGGGSVFVNSLHMFPRVVANDVITPLTSFYQLLQYKPWNEVITAVKTKAIGKNSQADYLALRERFNQTKDPVDFFILVCSCTNNMMRFNKKFEFNQTWGKRCFNPSTEGKLRAYHSRIYNNSKLAFNNRTFQDCLSLIHAGDFVYLDPPYLVTEAGYNAFWSRELEESLYEFLDALDAKGVMFLFSNVAEHKGVVNPYMHRLTKYTIVEVNKDYDKVSRDGKSNSREILVKNYG